jgi:hypothetical protein
MRTLTESILGDIDVSLNIADMYELRWSGGEPIASAGVLRLQKEFFASSHPDLPYHKTMYGERSMHRYLYCWLYEQPVDADSATLQSAFLKYWNTGRVTVERKKDAVTFWWYPNKAKPQRSILLEILLKKK